MTIGRSSPLVVFWDAYSSASREQWHNVRGHLALPKMWGGLVLCYCTTLVHVNPTPQRSSLSSQIRVYLWELKDGLYVCTFGSSKIRL